MVKQAGAYLNAALPSDLGDMRIHLQLTSLPYFPSLTCRLRKIKWLVALSVVQ